MVRNNLMRFLALVAAMAIAGSARAAEPARPDFNGIWFGDQGVLWDTSVKPGEPTKAPFTPEYAKIYAEARALAARGTPKADPSARCLPPGTPRIMAAPMPFEIVMTPKVIYFLHESFSQVRRLYMKGHEPPPYPVATFNGESIAHWEGDTLVVRTTQIKETVLDTTSLPVSDKLEVEERIRLVGPDKLEDRITLIDPKAFTQPWTVVRTYTRRPNSRILEYVCNENNRNPVDEEGNVTFHGAED